MNEASVLSFTSRQGLEADEFRFLRRTVIGIVLATDMASHADVLSDFTGECLVS